MNSIFSQQNMRREHFEETIFSTFQLNSILVRYQSYY